MNIFIDEAGVFIVPKKNKCSFSCIGALVIPEKFTAEIFEKFFRLKESWGIRADEVKGSKLAEPEVDSLLKLLEQHDVIFQVAAIDMNRQSNKEILQHIEVQSNNLTKNLTKEHQPDLIEETKKLKEELKRLSPQLYIQAVCCFELLYTTIQKATLYYAQRMPEELGEFYWYIDAKDKELTPFEKFWTTIVILALQSKSFKEPFIQLDEAGYSYFMKYCKMAPSAPEHLKGVIKNVSPFEFVAIRDIYKKHLNFEQSHKNPGIQIVDILTTSIRRAMNGKLNVYGWSRIGKLMVQSERGKQAIQLLDIAANDIFDGLSAKESPINTVVNIVEKTCKPMLSG